MFATKHRILHHDLRHAAQHQRFLSCFWDLDAPQMSSIAPTQSVRPNRRGPVPNACAVADRMNDLRRSGNLPRPNIPPQTCLPTAWCRSRPSHGLRACENRMGCADTVASADNKRPRTPCQNSLSGLGNPHGTDCMALPAPHDDENRICHDLLGEVTGPLEVVFAPTAQPGSMASLGAGACSACCATYCANCCCIC